EPTGAGRPDRRGRDDLDLEPDLRVVGSGLRRRPGADRRDARPAPPPFDGGRYSRRQLPAQGQAQSRLTEGPTAWAEHAATGMTRSLPRWVHRNTSRAPLRQSRGGRCAGAGPSYALPGQAASTEPRGRQKGRVRIRSANQSKVAQNSTGVDSAAGSTASPSRPTYETSCPRCFGSPALWRAVLRSRSKRRPKRTAARAGPGRA